MDEETEYSIYKFKISKEYKEYIDDLVRMGTIQIIANMMFYISNPMDNKIFSEMFGKTLFFILMCWLSLLVTESVVAKTSILNLSKSARGKYSGCDSFSSIWL